MARDRNYYYIYYKDIPPHNRGNWHLPASSNELIRDKTLSSPPNSPENLSSFSRSTNDFTADKLKLALSMMGEEPLDEARKSFIVIYFFPALGTRQ